MFKKNLNLEYDSQKIPDLQIRFGRPIYAGKDIIHILADP